MIIKNIIILFFFCCFVSCASVNEDSKEETRHNVFEGSTMVIR